VQFKEQYMMKNLLRSGDKIVIASHNAGKLREIRVLLAPYNIDVTSAGELGLPEPAETGSTFKENAAIKACSAQAVTGLPCLADDSGLEVKELGGSPGVYSADWAGQDRDFASAMQRVKDELFIKGHWTREGPIANFNATLALSWPDGTLEFFEGKVFGRVVWPPRGMAGFGYDPMFQPDGSDKTFGEMSPEEKNGLQAEGKSALSHRARALKLFIDACVSAPRQS